MTLQNGLAPLTPSTELGKIRGKISHYKKAREMANFFFTDRDRNIMGLSAIAGALAGAAGIAANTARDANNLREQADYIEMEVNGQPAKGWVWFSPFKNGDEVELIGTFQGDYFEIIAITRPQDRTIALYPHCSRGKKAHITTIIKWWLIATTFLVAIFTPALLTIFEVIRGKEKILGFLGAEYFYASIFAYLLFGTYSLVTGRKFMMYVHAATQVFKALGLPDPDNIDLPKRTKRKPGDPGAFGVMYFNY